MTLTVLIIKIAGFPLSSQAPAAVPTVSVEKEDGAVHLPTIATATPASVVAGKFEK